MQISVTLIKELRERTSAGVTDCKNALLEAGGDMDKASQILWQQGLAKAEGKVTRVATQGLVEAYIHPGGRLGALVEVNCESDFVAHTDEFKALTHNLALQVAATEPRFISAEEIPEGTNLDPKKVCLLEQPFIKDESKTIREIIAETISKVEEKIGVKRFSRFELGK
ncbi:MAG TPA: elongation factor Ts [Dehalococcoidia bacterium]|nr:elongation factor Ts [Dehalococcoidia bacterium]